MRLMDSKEQVPMQPYHPGGGYGNTGSQPGELPPEEVYWRQSNPK